MRPCIVLFYGLMAHFGLISSVRERSSWQALVHACLLCACLRCLRAYERERHHLDVPLAALSKICRMDLQAWSGWTTNSFQPFCAEVANYTADVIFQNVCRKQVELVFGTWLSALRKRRTYFAQNISGDLPFDILCKHGEQSVHRESQEPLQLWLTPTEMRTTSACVGNFATKKITVHEHQNSVGISCAAGCWNCSCMVSWFHPQLCTKMYTLSNADRKSVTLFWKWSRFGFCTSQWKNTPCNSSRRLPKKKRPRWQIWWTWKRLMLVSLNDLCLKMSTSWNCPRKAALLIGPEGFCILFQALCAGVIQIAKTNIRGTLYMQSGFLPRRALFCKN